MPSSSHSPLFTSLHKSENRPLVSAQTSSSPANVSSSSHTLSSHLDTKPGVNKSREPFSGLKSTSLLGDPPSYQRVIPDVADERYQLVSRRETLSYQEMDLEEQQMREKDSRLKRNIRKFRFFVRCAHLACRFVPKPR
jgi:hypothetical protein